MNDYIDGFDLYHGPRDAGLRKSRWLDIHVHTHDGVELHAPSGRLP